MIDTGTTTTPEASSPTLTTKSSSAVASVASVASSSGNKRRTLSEFVENSFASVERLCQPISSGAFDSKQPQKIDAITCTTLATTNTTCKDQQSMATNNNNINTDTKSSTTTTTTTNPTKSKNKENEDENEDDDAFATLTYLALLSSLYLPLLLFLWIRRSMFGTASLCRSLFFGHMLRLIVAFTLLPPSTTKSFVPTWLWNLGVKIGNIADRVWKDKRTQRFIPTWFHLILAIVLGVENENIPSSLTLANLGSGHHEKDSNSWPPPSLVALGVFTFLAFVVHPDGLTWIMLGQIRLWVQNTFEQTRDGIHMIKDGTLKITLAEISGVIAGIIIIVTIFRALIDTSTPTEKVRVPKRSHKHKKGKKGKGGRHHHNNNNNNNNNNNRQRSSTDGGRSRIRSGHYRSAKDLYEPPTTSTPRSRSSSPSMRDRSESDMVATAVSTLSDSGNFICPDVSNEKQHIDSVKQSKSQQFENLREEKSGKKSSGDSQISTIESTKKVECMAAATTIDVKSSDKSLSTKHQFDHSHMTSRTTQDKQKRGHLRKNRKLKQNSTSNFSEKERHNYDGKTKQSTPNRTYKSQTNARKQKSEERYRNQRSKDFECDVTVGSTASCSASESLTQPSRIPSGHKASPARLSYDKKNPVGSGQSNRRRSFTDPQAVLSNHPLPPESVSLNPTKYQPIGGANEIYQAQDRSLHLSREAEGSLNINSSYRGVHNQRIHTLQTNQMYTQQYGPIVGHDTGEPSLASSPNGGNGPIVRPPPGLMPRNSMSNSSIFACESVENGQQTLPYMSSSTISTYNNFSNTSLSIDAVGLNSTQSTNEQFSISSSKCFNTAPQQNVTLPPISPLQRRTPPPIGHERTKIHNEEEIEANLLALGGQMAGSILDF